jgi:hypothetical protein
MSCSFCGRHHSVVAKLVAGPISVFRRVYICDQCAVQTIRIMEAASGDNPPREQQQPLLQRILTRLGIKRHHDVAGGSECHAI